MRELRQALIARLAHVPFDPGVRVVRVYLEWDEAERVQGWWLNNGHIVSRFNRGAGDIRAGAPTDIGHAGSDALTNDVIYTRAVEAAKEIEGITTSDGYCFCAFDRGDSVSCCME